MKNISLIAPINQLGYGIASLNILKSLSKKLNVSLWPIGQPQITNKEDYDLIISCIENAKKYDHKAPCIRIWHQNDLAQYVGKGEHVGFPIFELDNFSSIERHHLKSCDRLFVCSDWAKKVVQNVMTEYERIYYYINTVPLGVDTSIFKPCMSENKNTIFFNCGKWEVRKGHDILIKAFTCAFSENDDAELWMMCENPFCSEEEALSWENKYKNNIFYNNGKIKLIPRVKTHEEVYNIMRQVDCGVFPSKAEGWNLEALEILSCGKELIITDYSAHTEFCNTLNSNLIPVEETELAFDNKWFFGQGSWAKLEDKHIDIISKYMKQIHEKKQNNQLKLNYEGIETANKFTWDYTCERILDAFSN